MKNPLQILIVEDNPDDAELLLNELRRAGFDPQWTRVQTEPEFLAGLEKNPDIVISDFAMPCFNGLRAAELLQASGHDIPFILVSGTVGEDVAVEAMKRGATDYLLKDRVARLGNAVQGALDQKRLRDERKRVQAELLWKTTFLEAQLDSAIDGILVVDEHAKRILQNRRLFQIFKVPDAIANDDDDAKLLQHVTRQTKRPEQFRERVAHLYAHPDEIGRDEIELADGTILDRYSAPVRDKAGKYYGRIWTFRDITEHRRLEEQLRHAQKMEAIGLLAGGVAHDFNNILATIKMQSDLMGFDEDLSDQQKEGVDEINAAAERATNLTRQLLLFSRHEKIQPRDMDLGESISNMAKMLRRLLGENVQMQFKFASQPMLIQADPGMIDQIVMNLAINSRDAMPNGGNIFIETSPVELDELGAQQSPRSRPGSFVCLSVTDTGSGIPPEIIPRIFEPFFTTKDVGKGTGLGLATVFGIVEQHRGWIDVYSEAGRGTTFRIYFPRLATASSTRQPGKSIRQSASRGHETILLVEDDASLRQAFKKTLKQLGYRVLEASDGESARKKWGQHPGEIRLLLTDLVMPGGLNGKEVAQKLLLEKPELKVIYMSGHSPDITLSDLRLGRGIHFLAKPFDTLMLAQTIRTALETN